MEGSCSLLQAKRTKCLCGYLASHSLYDKSSAEQRMPLVSNYYYLNPESRPILPYASNWESSHSNLLHDQPCMGIKLLTNSHLVCGS